MRCVYSLLRKRDPCEYITTFVLPISCYVFPHVGKWSYKWAVLCPHPVQHLCYLKLSYWAVWESIWCMVRNPLAPLCSEIVSHWSSVKALVSRILNFFWLVNVQDRDKQIVICGDFKVLLPCQEHFTFNDCTRQEMESTCTGVYLPEVNCCCRIKSIPCLLESVHNCVDLLRSKIASTSDITAFLPCKIMRDLLAK